MTTPLNELSSWEVTESQFGKSTIAYWEPYLSQIDDEEWYLYESPMGKNNWELKSPFLNTSFNQHIDTDSSIRSALYRMENYYKVVEDGKSSIGSIGVVSTYVEKWMRDTYLSRFLISEFSNRFSDEEIWELISDIWTDVEFPCSTVEGRERWKTIFNHRPRPESLVTELPDVSVVYRGGHPEGYGWSPSLETATWFYNRNKTFQRNPEDNYLTMRTVSRDDVAFIGDREEELVLFPKETFSYEVLAHQVDEVA